MQIIKKKKKKAKALRLKATPGNIVTAVSSEFSLVSLYNSAEIRSSEHDRQL